MKDTILTSLFSKARCYGELSYIKRAANPLKLTALLPFYSTQGHYM